MSATTSESAAVDLLAGTLHGRPRTLLRDIVLALLRPLLSLRLIGVENVPLTVRYLSHRITSRMQIRSFSRRRFRGRSFSWGSPSSSATHSFAGSCTASAESPSSAAPPTAPPSPRRAVLEQGIALGIYPEGVRSKTAALVKGLPGAGLIALQSDAPCFQWRSTGPSSFRSTATCRHAAQRAPARRHRALRVPDSRSRARRRKAGHRRRGDAPDHDAHRRTAARAVPRGLRQRWNLRETVPR